VQRHLQHPVTAQATEETSSGIALELKIQAQERPSELVSELA
jgi:hypothetical protein